VTANFELPDVDSDVVFRPIPIPQSECSRAPHRGPEGPNEDMSQCPQCWGFSWELRPEGETYGRHADDCSLPVRHESYCQPGGQGHPDAPKLRGYFPGEGIL
jgi:hypothetical protein